MLATVWPDVRVAARSLWRSRGFSFVAILTLAAGIAVATLVFTAVNSVLLRPIAVQEPEQLVVVSTSGEMAFLQQEPLAFGDYQDLAKEVPAFQAVVAHRRVPAVIGLAADSRVALGENVSPNYFLMLGVPMSLGRPFTPDDSPDDVVVLNHSVWRRRFGADATLVGRQIEIGGRRRVVVGVAAEGFTGLFRGITPEFWIPVGESTVAAAADRNNLQWWVHARLRSDSNIVVATEQVASAARSLAERYPDSNTGRRFQLTPFNEASIHPAVPRVLVSAGALGVLSVSLLVLVVACINVANLVLARATMRQREIAIRGAIGASRWRILRQMFAEGLLLSVVASTLALLFALWLGRALSVVPLPTVVAIDLQLTPDWRVFMFTAAIGLFTAVLFSIGPALRVSRASLVAGLGHQSRTSTSSVVSRWRTLLLSTQAAVAMLLLVLGGLALRSLAATTDVHPGFEIANVTVASAGPSLVGNDRLRALNFFNESASRVRGLPGVEAAGWIHPVPLSLNIRVTRLRLPGHEGIATRELPFVDAASTWPGVFDALRVPFVQGRDFTDGDTLNQPMVAIVNETFARRYWPGQLIIGQHIAVGFPDTVDARIIGVVRDFKNRTLGDVQRPMVFTSGLQDPLGWQAASLIVRQSPNGGVTPNAIAMSIREADPSVPVYDVQPMTTRMAGVLLLPQYAAALFGGIGFLSLVLVAVGLFGTVSFWVHSRVRELGVRLALGSTRSSIVWLVTKQTLVPVGIGVAVGTAAALVAARSMAVLLYDVAPHDALALSVALLVLFGTAVGASAVPSWRAARLDPMSALRVE